MSILRVTGFTKAGTHNGTSIAVTVSGLVVGDTLTIKIGGTSGLTVTGIVDNATGGTNSYVAGPSQGTNVGAIIWYCESLVTVTSLTTITITLGGTHTESSACVEEYSGVKGIGNTGTNSGSSTAPAVAVTTQDANNFVVMCGVGSGSATWSATSPNVVHDSIASPTTGGEVITAALDAGAFASAGSHTVTGTLSASEAWGAVGLELRSVAFSPISGSSSGKASASSTLKGSGALSGTATGVSAAASPIKGAGALAGSASGKASASGPLQGLFEISGSVSGHASVSATLKGAGAIAAAAAGHVTTTATLKGAGAIAAAAAGHVTTTASLKGAGALLAAGTGKATVGATLAAKGILSGAASGKTSLSGTVHGGSGANLSGSVVAAAAASATISATGSAIASANGRAVTTATLKGAGELRGAALGQASLVGRLSTLGSVSEPTHGIRVQARDSGKRAPSKPRGTT